MFGRDIELVCTVMCGGDSELLGTEVKFPGGGLVIGYYAHA
jgi:hypothetical protein